MNEQRALNLGRKRRADAVGRGEARLSGETKLGDLSVTGAGVGDAKVRAARGLGSRIP
jgi:hypothetical protein